jgi:hypothetical protein
MVRATAGNQSNVTFAAEGIPRAYDSQVFVWPRALRLDLSSLRAVGGAGAPAGDAAMAVC